jgi:hypothetical protein
MLFLWYLFVPENCYLEYIDQIDGSNDSYVLYTEMCWIWDRGWYILKQPYSSNIKEIKIEALSNERRKNIILWNWSEDWDFLKYPNIKLKKDKYLIFERGGYYFWVYDIELKKSLFDITNSWWKVSDCLKKWVQECKRHQILFLEEKKREIEEIIR